MTLLHWAGIVATLYLGLSVAYALGRIPDEPLKPRNP